jgi:HPr kinase/phosphorylase
MMGLGARLVADDRVELTRRGDALIATCPAPLLGLIEARGLGILRADPVPEARVILIADLTRPPADRLPPPETFLLHGCEIDLVRAAPNAHFPASLVHYLRHGRAA